MDADGSEIRAAFRRRARETHPDQGGDAQEFQAVVSAYQALKAAGALNRRRNPYRAILTSLDEAARMTVDPPARPRAGRDPGRFDDLLQVEIRRQRRTTAA